MELPEFASFKYSEDQRKAFRQGALAERWVKDYPDIFDKDDKRLAQSQGKRTHFHEWLAAVLLYNLTGYLSLIEKYQFKNHAGKRNIMKEFLSPDLINFICDPNRKGAQFPDLLVYKKDYTDWFFCEVKGPGDKVRQSQSELFEILEQKCNKQVQVIKFQRMKTSIPLYTNTAG